MQTPFDLVPIEVMFLGIPLLLVVATCQDATGAWTRLERGSRATLRVESLAERGGGRLVSRSEGVYRVRKKVETRLPSTQSIETGKVHSLAADPAGLTFLAAENGLFVTSPGVEVLDRLELEDGAPPGSPTSLFVDEQRRLWYATDLAFGCIDPSFYFGRTIPVPSAGPYHISEWDSESITLSTADGVYQYSVDAEPAPKRPVVSLDGRRLEPGQSISTDFGEVLPLSASGEDSLTFRYRVDLHHKWLPLAGGIDIEIEPGEHTLDIVAMDRDLRLSSAFPLRLSVDYPFYYKKSFVLGLAAAATALLFVLFQWLGHRQPMRIRVQRAALSTVLVLVLALQLIAGLIPHGRGWPFIGYSMYTTSLDVGHLSYNGILIGLTVTGKTQRIRLGALGVAADNRWQVLGPLIRGGDEINRSAMEKINRERKNRPIRALQVWAERTRLTADGPLPIAELILSNYVLPNDEAPE